MKTILFVANRAFALTSSRLGIITSLIESGYQVIACVGLDSHVSELEEAGVIVEPISVDRGGPSVIRDIRLLLRLTKLYRKWKPDLIHNFHAKPIVFGAFASYATPKAKVVNNFEGLGFPFVSRGVMYRLSSLAFKMALYRSSKNVFLNQDDMELFIEKNIVPSEKSTLIFSPGVDVNKFKPIKIEPADTLNIITAGRLLWSKGIREFCLAAAEIKKSFPKVNFFIAGEWDSDHSDAIDQQSLYKMTENCGVEFLGYVKDMPGLLSQSHCFVLATKYREGVPRVVLEAQSSGIPVITTDVPGCRHAVVDGETGYVIPPDDVDSLVTAITKLVSDGDLRARFSNKSVERAIEEFDTKIVTNKQLDVYRSIGFKIGNRNIKESER